MEFGVYREIGVARFGLLPLAEDDIADETIVFISIKPYLTLFCTC